MIRKIKIIPIISWRLAVVRDSSVALMTHKTVLLNLPEKSEAKIASHGTQKAVMKAATLRDEQPETRFLAIPVLGYTKG
jgi:hypothetical protein